MAATASPTSDHIQLQQHKCPSLPQVLDVGGGDCEPDISGLAFSPSGRRLYVGTEGGVAGACPRAVCWEAAMDAALACLAEPCCALPCRRAALAGCHLARQAPV